MAGGSWGKRGRGGSEGDGGEIGRGLRTSCLACCRCCARSCRHGDRASQRCWHTMFQVSCQRSLQTPLQKVSIGFTCVRSHRIPLPFKRASTTRVLARSTIPEPMGQPARRKVGDCMRGDVCAHAPDALQRLAVSYPCQSSDWPYGPMPLVRDG
jgi:hypothetical protein